MFIRSQKAFFFFSQKTIFFFWPSSISHCRFDDAELLARIWMSCASRSVLLDRNKKYWAWLWLSERRTQLSWRFYRQLPVWSRNTIPDLGQASKSLFFFLCSSIMWFWEGFDWCCYRCDGIKISFWELWGSVVGKVASRLPRIILCLLIMSPAMDWGMLPEWSRCIESVWFFPSSLS